MVRSRSAVQFCSWAQLRIGGRNGPARRRYKREKLTIRLAADYDKFQLTINGKIKILGKLDKDAVRRLQADELLYAQKQENFYEKAGTEEALQMVPEKNDAQRKQKITQLS